MAGQDVKALLAGASLPRDTVSVCLRGDLLADFHTLEAALAEELSKPNAGMLTSGAQARVISEEIEGLRGQMRDASLTLTLEALDRRQWRALLDEHPPRKQPTGEVDDRDAIGVNTSTFFPVLVRRSVVAPVLDDDDWDSLLGAEGVKGKLADSQFDAIATKAWTLNRSEVSVPFSRLASKTLTSSGSA